MAMDIFQIFDDILKEEREAEAAELAAQAKKLPAASLEPKLDPEPEPDPLPDPEPEPVPPEPDPE